MRRKHFLLLLLGFQIVFNFIKYNPDAPHYDLFLWSDSKISIVNYVYYLFEHLSFLYLCWLCSVDARPPDKYITRAFFFLAVFDFIDFIGGCNTPWVVINGFPIISWNITQVAVFILAMFRDKEE